MKRVQGVTLFLIALLLYGCTFRENKLKGDSAAELRPWFSNLFVNLIGPKCMRCHEGTTSSSRIDLSTYEAVLTFVVKGRPEASVFYTTLNGVGGRMPLNASPLSQKEIRVIYSWILAQAPSDEGGPSPPEPSPEPAATFEWVHTHIFIPKCLGCHNGTTPEAGVNLENYESFATDQTIIKKGEPEKSGLYRAIKNDFMPLDRVKLSDDEKKLIFDWISDGALKGDE